MRNLRDDMKYLNSVSDMHLNYAQFHSKRDTGNLRDADAKLSIKAGYALYENQTVVSIDMMHNNNLKNIGLNLEEAKKLRDELSALIETAEPLFAENHRLFDASNLTHHS